MDLLLRFIDDADDDVVFAACESLRKVGSEHDTADLLARMQKIPEDRQTIREEIGKDCPGSFITDLKTYICQLFT